MKKLWKMVNESSMKRKVKNSIYVTILMLLNALAGAVLWLLVGRLILPGIDWLICFVGYPAVFVGFIGGTMYLYNHEFS